MTFIKPENFEKAFKIKAQVKSMEEETKMIEKNATWELVDLPKGN